MEAVCSSCQAAQCHNPEINIYRNFKKYKEVPVCRKMGSHSRIQEIKKKKIISKNRYAESRGSRETVVQM
jgi:hypothetical protein